MEVADQRHVEVHRQQALAYARHGGSGLAGIDGDAHDLGAGARQFGALRGGGNDVGGVGVGHRLHHHRGVAADDDAADGDAPRAAARQRPLRQRGSGHHSSVSRATSARV